MKWLGFKRVKFGSLHVSSDIKARTKEARVAELAESMRDATGGEPGNCPWVRRDGASYHVVAGRDRVAASMVLKAKHIWVRIGEFTERELLLAEVHENLRRRQDDQAELLARLVETTAQEVKACHGDTLADQTAIAMARKQVAEETGKTTQALKQIAKRQRAKAEPDLTAKTGQPDQVSSEGAAEAPGVACVRAGDGALPPPPIETWGEPISDALAADVADIQALVDAADAGARAVQVAMTKLKASSNSYPVEVAERHRYDAQAMASNIRASRPHALCPCCKNRHDIGDEYAEWCTFCSGSGWVTEEQLGAAPDELKRAGVYAVDGKFVAFDRAREIWAGRQAHEEAVRRAPEIVEAMTLQQLTAAAKVGLNALIDEATGFQALRTKDDLRRQYRQQSTPPAVKTGNPGATVKRDRVKKLQIQDDAGVPLVPPSDDDELPFGEP